MTVAQIMEPDAGHILHAGDLTRESMRNAPRLERRTVLGSADQCFASLSYAKLQQPFCSFRRHDSGHKRSFQPPRGQLQQMLQTLISVLTAPCSKFGMFLGPAARIAADTWLKSASNGHLALFCHCSERRGGYGQ
jgi:hypothetical protein